MIKHDLSGLKDALLKVEKKGFFVKETILENVPGRNSWGEKEKVVTITSSTFKIIREINTIKIRKKRGKSDEINPEFYGFEYLFKLGDTIVLKPK